LNKEEGKFQTFDGLNLHYRVWSDNSFKNPVIVLHGLLEHSGRYEKIVNRVQLSQFSYFTFDLRGHGLSEGKRGHAEQVDVLVQDIQTFTEFVSSRWYPQKKVKFILLGHSFGGLLGIRFLIKNPNVFKAVILSSPCFDIKSPVPGLDLFYGFLSHIIPNKVIHSLIRSQQLTHDPEEWKQHESDPLIHNDVTLKLFGDMMSVMPQTLKEAQLINCPLLMLMPDKDLVVDSQKAFDFYENVGSVDKSVHVFKKSYHELLREKNYEEIYLIIKDFLMKYINE